MVIYPNRKDGKQSKRYPHRDISDMTDDEDMEEMRRKIAQDEKWAKIARGKE